MKRSLLFVVITLMMALAMVSPAFAGPGDPPKVNASIEITGDTLAVSPKLVDFGTHQLDGMDHTYTGTTTDWRVKDPTGTGTGWNVTISAGNFKRTGDPSGQEKLILNDGIEVKLNDIRVADGNGLPGSTVSNWTILGDSDASPVKIMSAAAGQGMGTFDFRPEFQLFVPAEVYAGTYNAIFTVAISSGP